MADEWLLFNDHAVGQVLGVVLEELGCGSGTVGQLQLLQLLQLDEARQTRGGQQGAAWEDRPEETVRHFGSLHHQRTFHI